MTRIQLLATGPELVGQGVRGVEPVLQELIESSREEIQLVVYVFGAPASGLVADLERAADRGVKVSVVVNRLDRQPAGVRSLLVSAARRTPPLAVKDFTLESGGELHAKACIVDRRRAVLGSANFSWGGLVANYELGVYLEGDLAWHLAVVADNLARLATDVR